MSALASCVMNKLITSDAIVMVNSISQTDGDSPTLLFKSIWVMHMWKVVLHGFPRVEEEIIM